MFRHSFFVLFMTLSIFNSYPIHAKSSDTATSFGNIINTLAPAINSAGTIDYVAGCAACQNASVIYNGTTLLESVDNDQRIELSVIDENKANSLFSELAANKDIPHGFPMDGCYARTHKMVKILEDEHGLIAGKAFVEGKLYVDTSFGEVAWGYHVAPVVMVRKNHAIVPYVFDPSLFSKPVPQTEWKAKMLAKSKSKFTREYYTNRFSYDPDDRTAKYSDYSKESLDDMEETNRNFKRKLFLYNNSNN